MKLSKSETLALLNELETALNKALRLMEQRSIFLKGTVRTVRQEGTHTYFHPAGSNEMIEVK